MSKERQQFFWKISEKDMKNTNLYITDNTEVIPMDTYGHKHEDEYHVPGPTERMVDDMVADWRKRNDDWNRDWDLRNNKARRSNAVFGLIVNPITSIFAYASAVGAFNATSDNYAETANFYIGLSGVGFALLAGWTLFNTIKSAFDWRDYDKKVKSLED